MTRGTMRVVRVAAAPACLRERGHEEAPRGAAAAGPASCLSPCANTAQLPHRCCRCHSTTTHLACTRRPHRRHPARIDVVPARQLQAAACAGGTAGTAAGAQLVPHRRDIVQAACAALGELVAATVPGRDVAQHRRGAGGSRSSGGGGGGGGMAVVLHGRRRSRQASACLINSCKQHTARCRHGRLNPGAPHLEERRCSQSVGFDER